MKQKNGKFLILSGVLLLVSSIVTPYGVNALSATNATAGSATASTATIANSAKSTTTAKSTNKAVNTSGLDEFLVNNEGYSYTEMSATEEYVNGNFKEDTEEGGKMCDFTNNGKVDVSDVTRFQNHCSITEGRDSDRCDLNGDGYFNVSDISVFYDKCVNGEILGKDTEEGGKMCDFTNNGKVDVSDVTRFQNHCSITEGRDSDRCDLNKDGKFDVSDISMFYDKCVNGEILGKDTEENDNNTFNFKTISIANPNNPSEGITIMDRNLGATSNDITSKNSFGYHFQWGNNYGFSQGCFFQGCSDNVTKTSVDVDVGGATWNNSFNNSGFYGKKFIKGKPFYLSYWNNGKFYNGLWGGIGDNPSNNWGANQTNPEDRQGPCPDGYHVPSAGEWGLLVKYWGNTYAQNELMDGGDGFYYLSGNDIESNFRRFFRIPYAGIRDDDNALLYNQGNYGEYWSSSPNGNAYPDEGIGESRIHISSTYGIPGRNWMDSNRGLSVRCFKNTYEPVASLSGLQSCVGMDSANVTHTINNGTITLKWDEIQGDFVDVAIYTNSERGYISAGAQSTVSMKDKKFDYKIERSGKHKFMLRNGCKNFYYTVNISEKTQNKIDDVNINEKTENKVNDVNIDKKIENKVNNINAGFTTEMKDAYEYAYENGITTVSIDKSRMNSPLTRIQMAKMLSNYAINVLGKQPDLSKGVPIFNDVTNKLNKQYDNAVTLSYQLGIMGQNIENGEFRPYNTVTRAEFGTALSRALFDTEDGKGNTKYYEPHLTKLYNEGIISNTNPKLKEKRGYVMTMLKRTAE